jgi:hypothetical protein
MPIARSFAPAARRPHILRQAQEFLTWLYTKWADTQELRLQFWLWYLGITKRQAKRQVAPQMEQILSDSADWNWPQLQQWLRETIEEQFQHLAAAQGYALPVSPRALVVTKGSCGVESLRWVPMWPHPLDAQRFGIYALDELLTDLHGVTGDVVGRCRVCQHYFIRRRAGRGDFCSPACRYKAKNQRRRVHPTPAPGRKRSRKGASRGANPGA